MRRLDLDFQRVGSDPGRAGWILLAVAFAFAADVGHSHYRVREELVRVEALLAQAPAKRGEGMLRVALQPATPEDLAFARETISRLAMPWEGLFASLEFARNERVALLAVEPDPERGTVMLTGEARDYLAALSYLATLSSAKGLSRVHLVRHETRASDPRRAVSFTISAQWAPPR